VRASQSLDFYFQEIHLTRRANNGRGGVKPPTGATSAITNAKVIRNGSAGLCDVLSVEVYDGFARRGQFLSVIKIRNLCQHIDHIQQVLPERM